jgi:hypothetical protein
MRYVIEMGTDVCGTDVTEFVEFDDNTSLEEVDNEAWEMALQHAQSYFDVYECGDEPEESEQYGDDWITTDQVWYTAVRWEQDVHGDWPESKIVT